MGNLDKYEQDYKPFAWRQFTVEELSQWVSLLAKRATQRVNKEKAAKDITDARNYLSMLEEKLK